MKDFKYALLALLTVLAAGSACAQSMNKDSGYYGELGYTALKFDDGYTKLTPKLARFVIGNNIHQNLDLEAMASFTVSKDTWKEGTDSGELTGKAFGVYAKPKFEVVKDLEIFGRIGVSRTSWKSNSTSAGNNSDSFTKLAYGAGIQTQFTKNVYGQLDYMKLGKSNEVSAKGFTVSVGARF
jgi:opacity protein-like surface antigen